MIKVYYPSQYPAGVSPAQRFRIEQYISYLKQNEIIVDIYPFISNDIYTIFFKKGYFLKKIFGIFIGFVKRLFQLFIIRNYDFIFIQREASPIGPPIFEWIYAKLLRKKIIFDFDDAIWLQEISDANKLGRNLKCLWKTKYIIKWSNISIAGNNYLLNFSKNYNPNSILMPTSVDTKLKFNSVVNQNVEKITIGWTGSFSTMIYLEKILPHLHELENIIDFNFILISNKQPSENFKLKNLEFVNWSEENEIKSLLKCQIGLMPMVENEYSKGKCGFKIIQYMSLGIVPVADNWGANSQIIDNEINGILISENSLWLEKLVMLSMDLKKRQEFAKSAVEKIKTKYSIESNFKILLECLSNNHANN